MKGYKLIVSSSIVPFREKAERTWDIERYVWPRDIFKPCVFFGMYHVGDYWHYVRHLGPKSILWAGSDITSLIEAKLPYYKLFTKADNYCENGLEKKELDMYNIRAKVVPSFLEEIPEVSFYTADFAHVYLSLRPNREDEYGLGLVKRIHKQTPKVIYDIYGVSGQSYDNIIFHGNVPNKQFNKEIKNYHASLRPNEHDGFSELTAKAILQGQYPITKIKYVGIPSYETEEELIKLLNSLSDMTQPNLEGRQFYIDNLNKFPWCLK